MTDFDHIYDRKLWRQDKWGDCREGEIPMWIADMDFATPEPILNELRARLDAPTFGYDSVAREALPAIIKHYKDTYGCEIEKDWITFVPSVMPGINVGSIAVGGSIMYCEPIYGHIRRVPGEVGVPVTAVPLKHENNYYSFDFDAMEKAITPEVKIFILCNPHNPVGRCFKREELMELLEFCKKHDLTIISDEIHCEIVFEGEHIPLFALCEEAKKNTITLSSAGKICNIPLISLGFAIIPDEELRAKFRTSIKGFFSTRGNTLGGVATKKAFDGSCEEWKNELRDYLKGNRDYMEERIAKIDGISVNHNEATYMAWIDCSKLPVEDPYEFFRENAKVFMTRGKDFGDAKCVRINFACPRTQLIEALDRIEAAVKRLLA